jgi:hypothetical protein
MEGTLYIDLLKGDGVSYKPAILYFEAKKLDGAWKYTQFKHLDILISFDLEGNPKDKKYTHNEITYRVVSIAFHVSTKPVPMYGIYILY